MLMFVSVSKIIHVYMNDIPKVPFQNEHNFQTNTFYNSVFE